MKNFLNPAGIRSFGGKLILISAFALFASSSSFGQCKGFVKKQIKNLSPFIHNGQVNSSVLLSGDQAELTLTFYSGQTYRILVSAHESLGDVHFVMKDASQTQLFTSKDMAESDYWDFTVESTQQMTLELNVPDTDTPSGLVPSGCVSILVGFKE